MAEEDKLTIKLPKKANMLEGSNKKVKIVLSKTEPETKEREAKLKTNEIETKVKTNEIEAKVKTKEREAKVKTNETEAKTRAKVKTKEIETDTEISMASSLLSLKNHCKQLGIKGIAKKNKTELLEIIKNHN